MTDLVASYNDDVEEFNVSSKTLQERFLTAAAMLNNASSIATAGHVRPDGDALGSMLGLAFSARDAGKKVSASFGDPFLEPSLTVPHLDTSLIVPSKDFDGDVDLLVVVDVGLRDRVGSVLNKISSNTKILVVDHHRNNPDFGDAYIGDGSSSSAAELVFRLVKTANWFVSPESAEAFYTGIFTDTGRFGHSSVSASTLRTAAELVELGARPGEVSSQLYSTASFEYMQLLSRVLGRAVFNKESKIVWSSVMLSDLKECGVSVQESDRLIGQLRQADGSDISMLCREDEPGSFKVSLRSRGGHDVALLASEFGGGGHRQAAGFTVYDSLDDIVANVTRTAPQFAL